MFSCLSTGRISNLNLANEYSSVPESFNVLTELVHEKDSSLVFLKIIKNPLAQSKDKEILGKTIADTLKNKLVVRVRIITSYESRKTLFNDTIVFKENSNYNEKPNQEDGNIITYLSFRIPRFKNQNSLLGLNVSEVNYMPEKDEQLNSKNKNSSQIIVHSKTIYKTIQEKKGNTTQFFYLRSPENNYPLFRNYLKVNEPFIVEFPLYLQESMKLDVHYFDKRFIPAPPPMASVQKEMEEKVRANPGSSQFLESKETFNIKTNNVEKFNKEGLYLFLLKVPPINDEYINSVLVVNSNYPHIEEASIMIPPLIYISTSDEYKSFNDTLDRKKIVDDFWLTIAKDKNHARNMIREFYRRVENANSLFTSHKEGWKTDRGMIYIIFGEPQSVYRTGNSEIWEYFYQLDFQSIAFKFVNRENIFSLNHYEMLRSPGYTEIWYTAVEQWRAGVLKVRE
ncbi:MAG: hypothetical protein A3G23_05225 [Bacteroidetes bacterium RIFCSPLOWO2_12_FULL_37_12]|nr:MAG: hypothetical protein A3G23_05225 [Bacteroidetes bacterium RIFCSPLOWO2_12_FULL_37_12]